MQLKKALVFSHSASLEGLGQLVNIFFLMQKTLEPISGLAQGGPGGAFMDPAEG